MITADAPEAYGYTIFCDDIRIEIGGKLTYVGAYPGRMFVHGSFPVTLLKLALGIVYFQRHDKVEVPVKFWIFLPGDEDDKPSILAEMPEEASRQGIAEGHALAEKAGTEVAFTTLYSQFALAPLQVKQPGLIKVRVVRGDRLIRLGSLEILPAPEGAASATVVTKSGHSNI